jgi:hypothetical protein
MITKPKETLNTTSFFGGESNNPDILAKQLNLNILSIFGWVYSGYWLIIPKYIQSRI